MLAYTVLTSTIQVMAAGPLLRCRGARPAVLLPYFEQTLPAMLLIALGFGYAVAELLLRRMVNVRPALPWFLPLLGLLALAYTGAVRRWPWPVRLVLHAAWLLGVAAYIALLRTGVITIQWLR